HPPADAQHQRAVTLDQRGKRGLVAADQEALEQRGVARLRPGQLAHFPQDRSQSAVAHGILPTPSCYSCHRGPDGYGILTGSVPPRLPFENGGWHALSMEAKGVVVS